MKAWDGAGSRAATCFGLLDSAFRIQFSFSLLASHSSLLLFFTTKFTKDTKEMKKLCSFATMPLCPFIYSAFVIRHSSFPHAGTVALMVSDHGPLSPRVDTQRRM